MAEFVLLQIRTSVTVWVQTQLSSTLSYLPIRTFQVIKGKEKKQITFSYISVVIFLCYITYMEDFFHEWN